MPPGYFLLTPTTKPDYSAGPTRPATHPTRRRHNQAHRLLFDPYFCVGEARADVVIGDLALIRFRGISFSAVFGPIKVALDLLHPCVELAQRALSLEYHHILP
jgi:hypothetical protein